jgi:hypothetical protein
MSSSKMETRYNRTKHWCWKMENPMKSIASEWNGLALIIVFEMANLERMSKWIKNGCLLLSDESDVNVWIG